MAGVGGVGGIGGVTGWSVRPSAPTRASLAPAEVEQLGAAQASGGGFAAALGKGIEGLQQLQSTSDSLAVQAATGDLSDIHDYTIAASQAKLATDVTVAVRNKAVEAFTEIMRMSI